MQLDMYGMASSAGGFFSGLLGRRRQGYGSIDDNNIRSDDDEELLFGVDGALLPGAEPPDRPGAPSHEEQQQQEQQPPPPPATPPPIVNPEDVESEEEAVQSLTQRLRCLFTVLTVSINVAINVNLNRLGAISQSAYLTFSIFVMFSYPPVAHHSDRHSPIVPPAVRAVRCLRHRPAPTMFGTASRICHHISATLSVRAQPSDGQIPSFPLLSGEGWPHPTAQCPRL